MDYLKLEHAEENLYFFEAVENLKLIESVEYSDAEPDADFFEGWRKIMKRHIDPGCPEAVNLPHELTKNLFDMQSGVIPNVTREAVTKELDKAEKEVVGMIAGVFPRFQASKMFKGYIQSSLSESTTAIRSAILPTSTRARGFPVTKVLLCESHELTGAILAAMLCSRHYSVTIANDGDNALKKLKDECFNIVLVNYDLPIVNAMQLVDLYQAVWKHRKVDVKEGGKLSKSTFICMLYDMSKGLKKTVMNAGYSATVVKPFSIEDFERAKAESGGRISKLLLGMKSFFE